MIKLSRTIPFEDSLLFWLGIKPRSRKGTQSGRFMYGWARVYRESWCCRAAESMIYNLRGLWVPGKRPPLSLLSLPGWHEGTRKI